VHSDAAFETGVGLVFPGVSVAPDSRLSSLLGVINLHSAGPSGTAELIMNLSSNLPQNPVMRVFDPNSGLWGEFTSGGPGELASAPATSSGCPASTSANFQSGLAAGRPCVRIRVQDGGSNDADGIVNGQAELMVNIAQSGNEEGAEVMDTVDISPSSGGGGGTGLWILALLMVSGLVHHIGVQPQRRL